MAPTDVATPDQPRARGGARHRGRRSPVLLAGAIVLALVAGCGGSAGHASGDPSGGAERSPAGSVTPGNPVVSALVERVEAPFSPDAIAAVQSLLGLAAVPVYRDTGGAAVNTPSTPVATFAVVETIAAAMAREASVRIGIPGHTIDAATGAATTADLLSWAAAAAGPASAATRELLGDQPMDDPSAVVVTPLVLALYAADHGPHVAGPPPSVGDTGSSGRIVLASDIRPAVPLGCGPMVATFSELLGQSGGEATDQAWAAVALLAQVAAMLEGREGVTLQASPPANAWATAGGPAVSGSVTLHAGDATEWAVVAGAPCLPLVEPSGPVAWHFEPAGNATVTGQDDLLVSAPGGADATLRYLMSTEPPGATEPRTSAMAVFAGYHHVEVDQLDALLRPWLATAQPAAQAGLSAMLARLDAVGAGVDLVAALPISIPVTYHVCGPNDACASTAPSAPSPAGTPRPIPLPDACALVTGDDVAGFVGRPARALEDPDDAVIDPATQSVCGYVIGDGSQGSARLNVSDPGSLDALVGHLSAQPLAGLGDEAFTWDTGSIHGVGVQVGQVAIWATIGTKHLPADAAESMVRLAVRRLGS
jgi:hypothetical protein